VEGEAGVSHARPKTTGCAAEEGHPRTPAEKSPQRRHQRGDWADRGSAEGAAGESRRDGQQKAPDS
jgi:hypothetical protein